MTTTTLGPNETVRDAALGMIEKMRANGQQVYDSLSDDQWFAQAGEGTNHAMWIAGHLATSTGYFAEMMGGENPAPESYHAIFDAGTEPSADRSLYPSPAEVRAEMEKGYAALRSALEGLSEAELAEPLSEDFQGFTRVEAALLTLWHDSFHAGQIASVRKAQGLSPLFM